MVSGVDSVISGYSFRSSFHSIRLQRTFIKSPFVSTHACDQLHSAYYLPHCSVSCQHTHHHTVSFEASGLYDLLSHSSLSFSLLRQLKLNQCLTFQHHSILTDRSPLHCHSSVSHYSFYCHQRPTHHLALLPHRSPTPQRC